MLLFLEYIQLVGRPKKKTVYNSLEQREYTRGYKKMRGATDPQRGYAPLNNIVVFELLAINIVNIIEIESTCLTGHQIMHIMSCKSNLANHYNQHRRRCSSSETFSL